ncbi:hypothetical protein JAAARDRAFT_505123 [Jaapia argillacea MUCL 33604]|uniref:Creatinase N-terminal domain-containing protein n=1 Tax=Jaapia argillacea MUCL 33604 TaxID=933084 RepID=A0A067PCM3_9AGAM|nr:hypothetical protein JAAARDRAFT_505123 [Jaapia argillacea MUCL 33604]
MKHVRHHGRLTVLRRAMEEEPMSFDYYIIPIQSVSCSTGSREGFESLSGYTGKCGIGIVSQTAAYILVQPHEQGVVEAQVLSHDWRFILLEPSEDWLQWLSGQVDNAFVGIDGHSISYATGERLKLLLADKNSFLRVSSQNLLDAIREKPNGGSTPLQERISTNTVTIRAAAGPDDLGSGDRDNSDVGLVPSQVGTESEDEETDDRSNDVNLITPVLGCILKDPRGEVAIAHDEDLTSFRKAESPDGWTPQISVTNGVVSTPL